MSTALRATKHWRSGTSGDLSLKSPAFLQQDTLDGLVGALAVAGWKGHSNVFVTGSDARSYHK